MADEHDIKDDVIATLEALQRGTKYEPPLMYLPDSTIIRLGGNPDDYPMLEGYPGVRVVTRR